MLLSFFSFGSDYTSVVIADKKGEIIYEEDSWKLHPFASVTKLMTATIVTEKIKEGKISYDDMVHISKEAAMMGGSRIELYWGSYVKLRDLLYASLIHSANNATYALAEHVAGSADKFVELMNKKATELGMIDTTFFTPTGLPPEFTGKGMDVGTAEDILKLSLYAMDNPDIMNIVGMTQVDINNSRDTFTIYNRNKLLQRTKGVTGLKTGHHTEAGYNMTVSFLNEGQEYVVVIFGAESEKSRDNELNYLISHFDKKDYMEKYNNKQKIINDKKEYIASYAVNILLDTLEEVNKGILVNYKANPKEKLSNGKIIEKENNEENTTISKTTEKEEVVTIQNKGQTLSTSTEKTTTQSKKTEKIKVKKKETVKKEKQEDIVIIKDDVDKILEKEQKLIDEYIYIKGDIDMGNKRNTDKDDYGVRIISD
jgi:D-alanyl-D-alanine carboxypeptidase (penicillin-binding protein 5/6)